MNNAAAANGQKAQVNVLVTMISKPNGAKLVYTAANGVYIGTVEFDCMNQEHVAVIANAFQSWAATLVGGIQVAQPGQIPGGLRKI